MLFNNKLANAIFFASFKKQLTICPINMFTFCCCTFHTNSSQLSQNIVVFVQK